MQLLCMSVLLCAKMGHSTQLQPGKSSPESQIQGCSKHLTGEGVGARDKRVGDDEGGVSVSTRLGGAGLQGGGGPRGRERERWEGI